MRTRKQGAAKNKGPGDYRRIKDLIVPISKYKVKLNVVLYGRAGSGKTTVACSFPRPILLLDVKDKGTDSVSDLADKDLHVMHVRSVQDLEETYWYLRKTPHNYKTVVIDQLSGLQDLVIESVLGQELDEGDIGRWGTMRKQDWGRVSAYMKTWIINFRDLAKVNAVFIAQDRVFNGSEDEDSADGQILPEVGPRLMPSVVSTLNAAVGIIGNTFVRETIREFKVGKRKIKKRKVEYCLRIGPHSMYITKIRKPKSIEVPPYLVDPDYDDIIDVMKGEA